MRSPFTDEKLEAEGNGCCCLLSTIQAPSPSAAGQSPGRAVPTPSRCPQWLDPGMGVGPNRTTEEATLQAHFRLCPLDFEPEFVAFCYSGHRKLVQRPHWHLKPYLPISMPVSTTSLCCLELRASFPGSPGGSWVQAGHPPWREGSGPYCLPGWGWRDCGCLLPAGGGRGPEQHPPQLGTRQAQTRSCGAGESVFLVCA